MEICNIRGHRGYITSATFNLLNPDLIVTGINHIINLLASDD
jgi:hypothetical protein